MFSTKFPRRFRNRVDQFSFGLGQQWVPDIEYQDDAEFIAQVPCFVLDGVVEDDDLTDVPLSFFEADSDRAVVRHD